MNQKVIYNASWIVGCKIIRAVLALIISMLTARYLGPSNFGLINYATSVAAFALPIMQLGLNGTLVQETIRNPNEEGTVYGTAMGMSVCSAAVCIVGILSFVSVANVGQAQTILVCGLYSVSLLLQAVELIQFWFQARYLSKYFAVASLLSYAVVSCYRLFLLVTEKSVYWFAVSYSFDLLLIDAVLVVLYRRKGGQKLRFDPRMAKNMFQRSKYYIVSGVMITLFGQTDKIMLTLMIDEMATGYYSAAVTCAGLLGFVFSAIIDSMRPMILEGRSRGAEEYEHQVKLLYALIVYLALFQSAVITLLAEIIITIIYGADYAAAIPCLRIIVWYTTFSYYGGAKDVWILAEEKQQYLVWLNFAGAVTNIVLNACFIPSWGPPGAAAASLITQFVTNIVMGFVIKPLRRNNILLLQSLNPNYILEVIRNVTMIFIGDRNGRRTGVR